MVVSCVYPSCNNSTRNGAPISYHRFPKNNAQLEAWKLACLITHDHTKNLRICGEHFQLKDFRNNGRGTKPYLVKDAVPKSHLANQNENSIAKLKIKVTKLETRNQMLKNKLLSMMELVKLLTQYKRRAEATKAQRSSSIALHKKKEMMYERITSKLEKNKIKHVGFRKKIENIFTPTQLRVIETGQSRANWTPSDIAKCLALRCISNKAYKFVREEWNFPMPCISTLKKTLSQFKISTGPIEGVFSMLKAVFENETLLNKQVIIAFDEMSISDTVCYIDREDRIIGPHQKLQLVCIRGIYSNFKVPIFMEFDFDMTKLVLDDLIDRLHNVGIFPRGITHDLGGQNRGLSLKQLGVTTEIPYYLHEKSNTKLWDFPDPAHVMKLIRNHYLDSGINLKLYEEKEKLIMFRKSLLEEIIDLDSNELKSFFKLTNNHLMVENQERQNVRMACEVFSTSTAKAIRKYSSSPFKEEIADFVQLVNDFWDIISARLPKHPTNEMKSAYGHKHLVKEQNSILNKFEEAISRVRMGVRGRSMKPFQEGFVILKRSLLGFWEEEQTSNIYSPAPDYVITSNFGQCFLENVFSQVRGIGGFNNNPTPKECIFRIQAIILSKLFGTLKSSNTMSCDNPNELGAELISFLKQDISQSNPESLSEETPQLVSEETPQLISEHTPQLVPEQSPEQSEAGSMEEITSENWSEFYNNLTPTQQCELGGEEHVAGFIAKKFYKKFPRMKLPWSEKDRVPQSWDQEISRGGLTVPSCQWLTQFRVFEKEFKLYHSPEGLSDVYRKGPEVMQNLIKHLTKRYSNIPDQVIRFYVKTRTYIRIKHLNMIREQKVRPNTYNLR